MKIEFLSSEDDGRGHFIVQRRITDDTGVVHEGVHVFPHDTLEWRAAEYGIDPTDTNTLMDIVLAEPYLTPEHYTGTPHLYDGMSTVEEARTAHLSRCAAVKLAHRISTRGKAASPLQLIRDNHQMHPEALALKRDLVEHGRQHQHQQRLAGEAERIADLRAARDHTRDTRRQGA